MTSNPSKILGINNMLKPGNRADITIFDPDVTYQVDSNKFYSKSRNTPFERWEMKGKAVCTIVDGKVLFNALS
jgi:dihydroorotase